MNFELKKGAWGGFKQREIDAAIASVLHKMGVRREVVVLAMLEDEEPIRRKEVLREDEIGNGWQFGEGIRRISKDEIELLMTALYESEDVALDQYMFIGTNLLHALCDETSVIPVLFNTNNFLAATR